MSVETLLAVLGGARTIKNAFKPYSSIGKEEQDAALRVLESGVLSQYLGVWHEDFYGGPEVRRFEQAWAEHFNVQFAVAVNSATSGLISALGAVGVEPGDEVIVSPWTMCASATSTLVWNAIPVFAYIEPETFNLDPESIEANITSRTKAIVVPDIIGHAADLDAIMSIAKKHMLKVIEDAAQAPGAIYKGKYVGTVADIGVFSLNYHKHIHTGEGGVCVTNDPNFAERIQLIRNHAEAVVEGKGVTDLTNLIGFNFRLGEIEAAIGTEQLKKLPSIINKMQRVADTLIEWSRRLGGIATTGGKIRLYACLYRLPIACRCGSNWCASRAYCRSFTGRRCSDWLWLSKYSFIANLPKKNSLWKKRFSVVRA
jgi:perosamine synthetase